jgi:hypothetical protein
MRYSFIDTHTQTLFKVTRLTSCSQPQLQRDGFNFATVVVSQWYNDDDYDPTEAGPSWVVSYNALERLYD